MKYIWDEASIRAAIQASILAPFKSNRICIDTRKLLPGDIFVACKGENVDGHDYVREAFEKGAGGAIVEHSPSGLRDERLAVVLNSVQAIKDLASFNRERARNTKIVAVTGSVGKTTTKEMLACALSGACKTYCSSGNYNNELGLPISLANMPPDSEVGVFECGMSFKGELTRLVQMLRPHVALITTIEAVHLEHFDSVEDIARAKAEIFSNNPRAVFLNGDNKYFGLLHSLAKEKDIQDIFSFGLDNARDSYLISKERVDNVAHIKASILNRVVEYKLSAYGDHNILNSIAVLSIIEYLGVSMDKSIEAIAKFGNIKGRGKVLELMAYGKEVSVIDDSYNASPASVRAALRALQDVPGSHRRVVILADMYELGPDEVEMHKSLIRDIVSSKVDKVVAVGGLMKHLFDELPDNLKLAHFKDYNDAIANLDAIIENKDVILIKGSFGTKIHKLVQHLETIR
jgi:UDP-N-acetylmuramoyl-tripeptide--D-alanyl-D-alanine ligase